MHVDGIVGFDPSGVIESARLAERVGYDGLWSAEISHDPFLPLVLAAEHTERIQLGTGIAVALARNPMKLATVANDLQTLSQGRFMLGLGSQIKPHIEKRFSMPWSHPAPRMRELILAIRAIWASWADGSRLAFRGEFYRHTLMTPMFDPGPNPFGNPGIFLAAVGEKMTEVAGEVADGLLAHGFTTERYLREVTIPALERGLAIGGKDALGGRDLLPGDAGDRARRCRSGVGHQSGQDPTRLLRLHPGLPAGARVARLGRSANRAQHAVQTWCLGGDGRSDRRRGAQHLCRSRSDRRHRGIVLERFGGIVDRFSIYAPYPMEPDRWAEVLAGFKVDGKPADTAAGTPVR